MLLIKLFISFFKTGLLAIGGAYAFIPLLEREVVEKYNWLTKEEFLDILGIVKVFPGAISIKYATYTGYKIAGVLGAVAANLGNLLAPAVLVLFASFFYIKYRNLPAVVRAFNMIQLVVFSMIIAVAFQLVAPDQLLNLKNLIIILASFALFIYTKIHPALIIIGAGILGILSR